MDYIDINRLTTDETKALAIRALDYLPDDVFIEVVLRQTQHSDALREELIAHLEDQL